MNPIELDMRAFNATYSFETAQLNHYVVRSREEFEWKRARGSSSQPVNGKQKFGKFADPEAFWARHDVNEDTDTSVLRWTAQAKDLRETFERAVASGPARRRAMSA